MKFKRVLWMWVGILLVVSGVLSTPSSVLAAIGGTIARLSVASNGTQANHWSIAPTISANGRYVGFISHANNLVPGDTNGFTDAFVHDRVTGITTRVSVASDGRESNGSNNSHPDLSADGRYAVFHSNATNLTPDAANGWTDIFVHDRQTASTTLVSIGLNGSLANGASFVPVISDNGRYIAYESYASNLVPNDTNGGHDVFVYDRVNNTTIRVSVSSTGAEASGQRPAISPDGSMVAFLSYASNLVPNDHNGVQDIFAHNLDTGETTLVSVGMDGNQMPDPSDSPILSADGRYVVFRSFTNIVAGVSGMYPQQIYVRDRLLGITTLESVSTSGEPGNLGSWTNDISPNGRYIVFTSESTNLVPNDTNVKLDVFLRDRVTGVVTRASVDGAGTQANDHSSNGLLAGNGGYIVFESEASNLISGDTNNQNDIFLAQLTWEFPTAVHLQAFSVSPDSDNGIIILIGAGILIVAGGLWRRYR